MHKYLKIYLLLIVVASVFVSSCINGKKKTSESLNKYENEKLYSDEFLVEDETGNDFTGKPYKMGVDGSFDDFVFAFASNKQFQQQRTNFPLLLVDKEQGDSTWVEKGTWNDMFSLKNFYTIMYDKEEDMEFTSVPSLVKAQVESIYLDDKTTKTYHFLRENDIWMLNYITTDHLKEYRNEEFVNFYKHFANDSVFQMNRVADSLEYVTSNPEDDFDVIETKIPAEEWYAMRPLLPGDRLININYGQVNSPDSKFKILAVKGIGNGFSNVLYFRLTSDNKWELFKFDDIGV